MTTKTKKIIAREGLIILGMVLLIVVSFVLESVGIFTWYFNPIMVLGWLGYPIYLLIRFTTWAIKTLRKK